MTKSAFCAAIDFVGASAMVEVQTAVGKRGKRSFKVLEKFTFRRF